MNTQRVSPQRQRAAADKIGPHDLRYAELLRRGFNKRFAGKPDYVRLVGSTDQVVDAVQDAVRDKLRVAVRSGGHCLEGFVADPAVRVVIDTLAHDGRLLRSADGRVRGRGRRHGRGGVSEVVPGLGRDNPRR